MALGAKLRQARQNKGLSQNALCRGIITRNMLSQIENGSANPSMNTLRLLADRLALPLSYFLEEQAFLSPNRELMEQARHAGPEEALALLENYQPGDCFDEERYLLEVLACLKLAEQALPDRPAYSLALLDRAEQAGLKTPYYTQDLARCHTLLRYRADPTQAKELEAQLPSEDGEILLRAEAALQKGFPDRCLALLNALSPSPKWHLLSAQAFMAQKDYKMAISHFQKIETAFPRLALPALEQCCRHLEDYKMAYHYACKIREGTTYEETAHY